MAFGLPMIASDIDRFAQPLDFGNAGLLVPAGDAAALANAMIALASDTARRPYLGNAIRDIIEKSLLRQTVAEKVLALRREAVARSKA